VVRLVPWESADVAALLVSGIPPADRLQLELARFDVAIAYTRSSDLVRGLASLIPRVIVHDPSPAAGHASAWLAAPLAELGVSATAVPPPCEADAHEQEAAAPLAALLPAGFLALHPRSGSAVKNWPADRFAELVARHSGGRPWLLIEGPADAAAAETLARVPGALRARELPPRVLGTLLSQAGAYVGNDSGVSHLAAAWGAPTLALFGPTDPAVWAPLGPRVRTLRSPTGAMDGLSVEAVAAELTELVRSSAPARPSG
jgi:ADP-heptose:LPS heptosyltransferase